MRRPGSESRQVQQDPCKDPSFPFRIGQSCISSHFLLFLVEIPRLLGTFFILVGSSGEFQLKYWKIFLAA